jgi:hypothetical protein
MELKNRGDSWWRIQQAITTFNKTRKDLIQTSELQTIDETMSAFCPQTTKTGDLPHLSFVARKPEPLGTEFKSAACPLLKVMTYLEICQGKNDSEKAKYKDEKAVCQTSTDGVCKVLLGDAWFGSVKTVTEMALRQKEGISRLK